jgi:hypothetical protein
MALILKLIKLVESLFIGFGIPYELSRWDFFTKLNALVLLLLLFSLLGGQLRPLYHILGIFSPFARNYWELRNHCSADYLIFRGLEA